MLIVENSFEKVLQGNMNFINKEAFIEQMMTDYKYSISNKEDFVVSYGTHGKLIYNPKINDKMALKLPKYIFTSFFETELNYFSELFDKDLPIAKVLGHEVEEDILLVEYIKGKPLNAFTESELIDKSEEFADFMMSFINEGIMPLIADKNDVIYSEEHSKFILVDLCKFYDVSFTCIRLPFILSYYDNFRVHLLPILNQRVKEKLNVIMDFVVEEYYNFME